MSRTRLLLSSSLRVVTRPGIPESGGSAGLTTSVSRGAKLVLKVLIFLLLVWFWCAYIQRNWDQIKTGDLDVNWGWLAFSTVPFLLGYMLMAALWSPFLRELNGISLPVCQAFRVSAISWVWRYVPGKVWAVASKAYLSARQMSDVPLISMCVTVEALWSQAAGLLMAIVIVPFYPQIELAFPRMKLLSAVLAALALLAVHPSVFTPLANLVLGLIRQPKLPRAPRFGFMVLLMAAYMFVFVLWSAGFVLFVRAFTPVQWADVPLMMSIFTGAWTLGVLSVFAPAGLGVRDSILAVAMGQLFAMTPGLVLTLVVGSRLMTMAVEFLCLALALGMPRSWRQPTEMPA